MYEYDCRCPALVQIVLVTSAYTRLAVIRRDAPKGMLTSPMKEEDLEKDMVTPTLKFAGYATAAVAAVLLFFLASNGLIGGDPKPEPWLRVKGSFRRKAPSGESGGPATPEIDDRERRGPRDRAARPAADSRASRSAVGRGSPDAAEGPEGDVLLG